MSVTDPSPAPPQPVVRAERTMRAATAPTRLAVAPPARRVTLYERYVKRLVDVVGSATLIVVLLPLGAMVALGVLVTLGAPVLFTQDRVGRNGRPFRVYKFRTMRPDRRSGQVPFAGPDRRRTHKCDDDPRHTRYGKMLRKTGLDELPQLFNVLRGDMSLVGPRPELVSVAAKNGFVDHPRHEVLPGITGPFQVSADRSGLIVDNLAYDLAYVQRVTFRRDISLLFRTIGAVAARTGR